MRLKKEKEEAEERKVEEGVVDEAEEVKEVFTLSGEEERKKRKEERKAEHERRMTEGVKECTFRLRLGVLFLSLSLSLRITS